MPIGPPDQAHRHFSSHLATPTIAADLAVSEVLTDLPEAFWVVPDGVVYAGRQSFWFGTAVTP